MVSFLFLANVLFFFLNFYLIFLYTVSLSFLLNSKKGILFLNLIFATVFSSPDLWTQFFLIVVLIFFVEVFIFLKSLRYKRLLMAYRK